MRAHLSNTIVYALLFTFNLWMCLLLANIWKENQLRKMELRSEQLELASLGYQPSLTRDDERFSRRLLSPAEPLLFIGGVPRSGTTLMRAMLDAHELIRCGEETQVIPQLLSIREGWKRSSTYLQDSGVSAQVVDDAVSAFISEVITKHGPPADLLCNKDPLTLQHIPALRRMFSNSKFILMIRDARATIHSMIERDVPVIGFNRSDVRQMFQAWNGLFESMHKHCERIPSTCLMVNYERLVIYPEMETKRILKFLDVPFSDRVLHHQDYIGNEIHLNKNGWSSSQVNESLSEKALTSWVGYYEADLLGNIDQLAPMLRKLGYDTHSKFINYRSMNFMIMPASFLFAG